MKDNLLTIEERRALYLEMLIEIDAFCRAHNIRYSLSSGTLIGALRHKGFIPWDDDLDITMPLPDMIRFKNEFRSVNMRFCDLDTCKGYEFPFPRIESTKTYSKIGPYKKGYGQSIDIYVVVGLHNEENERRLYLDKAKELFTLRTSKLKFNRKLTKILPIKILPSYKLALKEYRDYLFENSMKYEDANWYFRVASRMTDDLIVKNTLNFDFFDKLIDVSFEGYNFLATSHADEYLTQRYGDYMTPPPVEMRVLCHVGRYYWK